MPRIGTITYDLLISCPGDVLKFVDVVKDCIDTFNHTIGRVNNAAIMAKHWSTDSYPQAGDSPQELLNKQFVRDCDAAIVIFWTKFGSPTDKYGSGTEEEIEEMLSSDKQVFLYFVEASIDPSKLDMQQYQKVIDFKEKYKDRGLYSIVKDENDLRKEITNHLTMHFLPLLTGENKPVEKKATPLLKVRGASCDEDECAFVDHTCFLKCNFIEDKKRGILTRLNELQDNFLPQRIYMEPNKTPTDLTVSGNVEIQKLVGNTQFLSGKVSDVNIPSRWKDVITNFTDEKNIEVYSEFWNIGNLKKRVCLTMPASIFGGDGTTLEGSDEEQKRYGEIETLYWDIVSYNEYVSYFSQIDNQKFVALILANTGTTFDEDIDIKLFVKKGCILNINDFPVPEINIIKDTLEMQFLEVAYKIGATASIDKYSGYPLAPVDFDYKLPAPFSNMSAADEYEEQEREYENLLEQIFCYKYYQTDEFDILTYHVNYLKHNTKMAFPSKLIFKKLPETIDYEITSKYVPEVVRGHVLLDQEKKDS